MITTDACSTHPNRRQLSSLRRKEPKEKDGTHARPGTPGLKQCVTYGTGVKEAKRRDFSLWSRHYQRIFTLHIDVYM